MTVQVHGDLHDLGSLYQQDKKERQKYQHHLQKFGNWRAAAKACAFEDSERLQQAKRIITKNIDVLINTKPFLNMACSLVQHMDRDVPFQQWFLQHLHPGTENHNYLSERVAVNTRQKQKFGRNITNLGE